MASRSSEKKIKSADRVLDIFEMFNEGCNGVSVMDVVRALDLPQSSTSELLSSLVRRGYLTRKRGERKFRPTSRRCPARGVGASAALPQWWPIAANGPAP